MSAKTWIITTDWYFVASSQHWLEVNFNPLEAGVWKQTLMSGLDTRALTLLTHEALMLKQEPDDGR